MPAHGAGGHPPPPPASSGLLLARSVTAPLSPETDSGSGRCTSNRPVAHSPHPLRRPSWRWRVCGGLSAHGRAGGKRKAREGGGGVVSTRTVDWRFKRDRSVAQEKTEGSWHVAHHMGAPGPRPPTGLSSSHNNITHQPSPSQHPAATASALLFSGHSPLPSHAARAPGRWWPLPFSPLANERTDWPCVGTRERCVGPDMDIFACVLGSH